MHHGLSLVLFTTICALGLAVGCGDDDGGSNTTSSGNGSGSGASGGSDATVGTGGGGNGSGGATSSSTSSGQGGAFDCYEGGVCNPTVPKDCGDNGEACDLTDTTGFQCFPSPNDAKLGEGCNQENGPFCAHGLGCDNDTCAAFCCVDADCPSNDCVTIPQASAFAAYCAPQ